MIYSEGDRVTIRKNLTEDDLDSVELAWADKESSLGGLICEIRHYVGVDGYYKDVDVYDITVISDGRWKNHSWQVPGDWFHEPCMFDGVT